jgi:hypothetical protein
MPCGVEQRLARERGDDLSFDIRRKRFRERRGDVGVVLVDEDVEQFVPFILTSRETRQEDQSAHAVER